MAFRFSASVGATFTRCARCWIFASYGNVSVALNWNRLGRTCLLVWSKAGLILSKFHENIFWTKYPRWGCSYKVPLSLCWVWLKNDFARCCFSASKTHPIHSRILIWSNPYHQHGPHQHRLHLLTESHKTKICFKNTCSTRHSHTETHRRLFGPSTFCLQITHSIVLPRWGRIFFVALDRRCTFIRFGLIVISQNGQKHFECSNNNQIIVHSRYASVLKHFLCKNWTIEKWQQTNYRLIRMTTSNWVFQSNKVKMCDWNRRGTEKWDSVCSTLSKS